ncbi:MAG: hypothetical protein JNK14_16330 [Chitinophagaceae bacterium]|nr:hypothetical protein [Chitinophagaceae bacterium]
MKQILSIATLLLTTLALSCKTNNLDGLYVCDLSNKKADTTIRQGGQTEVFLDYTCTISEIDFKGSSTVTMKMGNGEVASSYVIDNDYVRIKGTGSDILLKIKDQKTLVGEGVSKGIYHKK